MSDDDVIGLSSQLSSVQATLQFVDDRAWIVPDLAVVDWRRRSRHRRRRECCRREPSLGVLSHESVTCLVAGVDRASPRRRSQSRRRPSLAVVVAASHVSEPHRRRGRCRTLAIVRSVDDEIVGLVAAVIGA